MIDRVLSSSIVGRFVLLFVWLEDLVTRHRTYGYVSGGNR